MFTRIFVPLDGSKLAEQALPIAERLASRPGTRLVLLHILERSAPATVHGDRHVTSTPQAESYLGPLAATLRGRGIEVDVHVHDAPEGDVAQSIAAHAEEGGADLIVLSTHGGGGVRGLLWGRIAQQVLQRGSIPVLLARSSEDRPASTFAPRQILVPLDGSAAGEAALDPAATLARELHASLHLVMVVATLGTVRGDRSATATLLPAATRALLDVEEERAEAYLATVAQRLRNTELAVDTEVRRGDVSGQISQDAAEHDVGLVVAATHGRAGLQALWSGSVAARLLARTAAPVLLLRRLDRA